MHHLFKNKVLSAACVLTLCATGFVFPAQAQPIFFSRGDLLQARNAEAMSKTADKRMNLEELQAGMPRTFNPWVEGIYNKTHFSWDAGFDAYSQGFAAGMDVKASDSLLLGAGYGYTKTKVRSESYKSNIYSDTYFLYGKYQPEFWYASTTLSYGRGRYDQDEQQDSGRYHVDTYHGQLKIGYDRDGYDTYSAIRYTYVHPDNYMLGNDFIEQKNSQVLTGVIGARMFKHYEYKSVFFKPELRIAALYDFKSNNRASVVTIPATVMTYRADGHRLKRFGGEFGVGMTAILGPVDISLNYDIEVRSKYTSQTGMVDMQYHF